MDTGSCADRSAVNVSEDVVSEPGRGPLRRGPRSAVSTAGELVRVGALPTAATSLPLLAPPTMRGVDLAQWVSLNKDAVLELRLDGRGQVAARRRA